MTAATCRPFRTIRPHSRQPLVLATLAASLLLGACGGGELASTSGPALSNQAASGSAGTSVAPLSVAATDLLGAGFYTWQPAGCTASASAAALAVCIRFDQWPSGQSPATTTLTALQQGASVTGLALTSIGRQLQGGLWVSEGLVALNPQPDGSLLLSGGRYGAAGLRVTLATLDLAGQPLGSLAGVPAGTSGVFPDGAGQILTTGSFGSARYRLSRQVSGCLSGDNLATCVSRLQTPADGTAPVLRLSVTEDNPAGLSYSFDGGDISTAGRVSVWRDAAGVPVRLGGGDVQPVSVDGVTLLQIGPLDAAVLDQLDGAARARLQRGERVLLAEVGARVWSGTLLPAGALTADDQPLRLNRTALDALLLGLQMPAWGTAPAVNGGPVVGGIVAPGSGTVLIPGDTLPVNGSTGGMSGSITLSGSGTLNGSSAGSSGNASVGGSLTAGSGASLTTVGNSTPPPLIVVETPPQP